MPAVELQINNERGYTYIYIYIKARVCVRLCPLPLAIANTRGASPPQCLANKLCIPLSHTAFQRFIHSLNCPSECHSSEQHAPKYTSFFNPHRVGVLGDGQTDQHLCLRVGELAHACPHHFFCLSEESKKKKERKEEKERKRFPCQPPSPTHRDASPDSKEDRERTERKRRRRKSRKEKKRKEKKRKRVCRLLERVKIEGRMQMMVRRWPRYGQYVEWGKGK